MTLTGSAKPEELGYLPNLCPWTHGPAILAPRLALQKRNNSAFQTISLSHSETLQHPPYLVCCSPSKGEREGLWISLQSSSLAQPVPNAGLAQWTSNQINGLSHQAALQVLNHQIPSVSRYTSKDLLMRFYLSCSCQSGSSQSGCHRTQCHTSCHPNSLPNSCWGTLESTVQWNTSRVAAFGKPKKRGLESI